MKNIKSFLVLAACICTTTLLHAQEVKTEIAKKTEAKAPPASTVTSIPSPSPELTPMNGITPKGASPASSPLTRNANAATNNLTPEQLKTLNGTAERPKQTTTAVLTPAAKTEIP